MRGDYYKSPRPRPLPFFSISLLLLLLLLLLHKVTVPRCLLCPQQPLPAMLSSLFVGAAVLLLPLVSCQNITGPDAAGKYWVYGEGISAAFIPYGASISNLIIKDQYGIDRDIVGGFDNASYCMRSPILLPLQ